MTNDIDLMNLHHVGALLGKTVEELGDLPVSSYHRWVVYLHKKIKAEG